MSESIGDIIIKTNYSLPVDATPQDILELEELQSHPSYLKFKNELREIENELKENGYSE